MVFKWNALHSNHYKNLWWMCHGQTTQGDAPKESMTKLSEQNELIHTNICGPFRHLSLARSKYFITFTYDYSWKIWTFFLPLKSWAFENFKARQGKATKHMSKMQASKLNLWVLHGIFVGYDNRVWSARKRTSSV